MTVEDLLPRLDAVRRTSQGYVGRCPAHADKSPSLAIKEGERGLLVKCWAGCWLQEICLALGIEQREFFFDTPPLQGHKSTNRPERIDRRALAFRFELAALDLRQRAERIIRAGNTLNVTNLNEDEVDQALGYVARAYADLERANLFEDVADSLRSKEFTERSHGKQRAA